MAGRQAKVLSNDNIRQLLVYARSTRHPTRNAAIVLLSLKAGLRAGEIAQLTWQMVVDADGQVGESIELHDKAAKKGSGRRIPIHRELRRVLESLAPTEDRVGPIIRSERGHLPMRPTSMVLWFCRAYRVLNLDGCSSHSGRRTFITRAARLVHKTGGSLRDVQLLAGHRSIQTTQRYIDGDTLAQRRLVALI
jgi:integrase/recombinase XerD